MNTQTRPQADNETHFLNVDVDVWAKWDLQPLVAALGDKVFVHYVGSEGGEHSAHFSLASAYGKDANTIMRLLVGLIENLPSRAWQLWNRARARDFNIGIQGGIKPFSHEIAFEESTLRLVGSVRGRIVITTYAVPVEGGRRRPAKRRSTRR
jgi:hypothetical protein